MNDQTYVPCDWCDEPAKWLVTNLDSDGSKADLACPAHEHHLPRGPQYLREKVLREGDT